MNEKTFTVDIDNLTEGDLAIIETIVARGNRGYTHYRISETTDHVFEIDDNIRFTLNSGEELEAVAIRKLDDHVTLFIATHCLLDRVPMYNKSVCGVMNYETSDLRKYINTHIIDDFPGIIKNKLVKFANDDYLSIPTFEDMFCNESNEDDRCRLYNMLSCRNRVCGLGINGIPVWYYLQNNNPIYSSPFGNVNTYGACDDSYVTAPGGVRLMFQLNYE